MLFRGALRTRGATLPARRELRFKPFSAIVAVPVPSRTENLAIHGTFDNLHGRRFIVFVFQPYVWTALIHRDFPSATLHVAIREVAGNASLG